MSKKIDEAKTCSVCGTPLYGVDESCPVCMLREGLADGAESGESSTSEETIKPTPEQATQRFEHYALVTDEDGPLSSWVAVRWGLLTRRWTSIYDAQWH